MSSPPGARPTDLRFLLSQQHLRLDRRLQDVRAALARDDRRQIVATWPALEEYLQAHFALEEGVLLPEFVKIDATEVDRLAQDHTEIRARAATLGQSLRTGSVDVSELRELLRMLDAHFAREQALLYQWADANLREEIQSTVRSRLDDMSAL